MPSLLPIDSLIPEVLEKLAQHNRLVLEAPPGAGKTTRVPPALLDSLDGEIWVLEPRRLAVRLAARRVAEERGDVVGELIGYQTRFEDVSSPRTRVRFLTEGILTRRMLSDPRLKRTRAVILDEFHERHLEGDLALALLQRLQETYRPDLKLVVMSATLDGAAVAGHLAAPVLRSEGRAYPLNIEYTPHSAAPLEGQVASAVERLLPMDGHVLVFLPGAAEIRRAATACQAITRKHGLLLATLHGDQTPEEQDRAVGASATPKVVLSTNVAESSVTIAGVRAVIDSGLARIATHSPWSGLPVVEVRRISQASASQRAGRAGRTGPGRVIRLYPLDDFVRRPAHGDPEIVRADLAPVALQMYAMGFEGFDDLAWLDPPSAEHIEHAQDLLIRLGVVNRDNRLTAMGRDIADWPLHPRLGRVVAEALHRDAGEVACVAAALLSSGERLEGDLIDLVHCEVTGRTRQILRQIRRAVRPSGGEDEHGLAISLLAGFPDRVARRRQNQELLMSSGGSAAISRSLHLRSDLLLALDAEDRRDQKLPMVRLSCAIEPEWLLDLFPDRIAELNEPEWNRAAERVDSRSALLYDRLPIEESRGAPDPEAAARMLAQKAVEAGVGRFTDAEEIAAFLARVAFASQHSNLPRLSHEAVRVALESLAQGLRSFSELRAVAQNAGLLRALEQQLPEGGARLLDTVAPARIRLPGGRSVKVYYAEGQPPSIASRLQDFFGMQETPRIAGGKVPLVVELLAPSQRPVQTTTDLAGFWQRLYPQVRRELMRRYPKHAWPENPK